VEGVFGDRGGTVPRFRRLPKDSLASELRASRPELSADFVETLSRYVGAHGRRGRLYAWSRVSFAGSLTVLVLGAFASFGGLGYAASGTREAVKAVKHVVAPSRPQIVVNSAASAQYAQPKVTVCHNGHTITIARAALPAHLRQGDIPGPCPPGGVAGATATRISGGVLGTSATSGKLPFTGVGLGVTVLVALLLVSFGLLLRRRAEGK
jgi:hypothetical protein